jgi:hypothetical protein
VDPYGNVVPSYVGTVVFTSSDSHDPLPVPYTFTSADAGTHTFSIALVYAGTWAIRASDSVHPSLTGLVTNIVVSPATAFRVVVNGYPKSTTVGTPNSFTVTLYDAYGNVATGYTGTLHFSSDDSVALLPSDWTFTASDAGTRTFQATFKTAGTHSLKAADTNNKNLSGTETGIVVS